MLKTYLGDMMYETIVSFFPPIGITKSMQCLNSNSHSQATVDVGCSSTHTVAVNSCGDRNATRDT